MPAAKPTRPTTAFKSPPAIRSSILNGQPKNIRQPIIAKKPSTKRVSGELPPFGENSPCRYAAPSAPSTRPLISGRIYCTALAACSPRPPAVSRKKQAIHRPMLAGLPKNTNIAAIRPITAPVATIVTCSFFIKSLPKIFLRQKYIIAHMLIPISFIDKAD